MKFTLIHCCKCGRYQRRFRYWVKCKGCGHDMIRDYLKDTNSCHCTQQFYDRKLDGKIVPPVATA